MTDPIELICEVEEAIADLQAMTDPCRPDPRIESEIHRLDDRIRQVEATQPVFSQPA